MHIAPTISVSEKFGLELWKLTILHGHPKLPIVASKVYDRLVGEIEPLTNARNVAVVHVNDHPMPVHKADARRVTVQRFRRPYASTNTKLSFQFDRSRNLERSAFFPTGMSIILTPQLQQQALDLLVVVAKLFHDHHVQL
jgi:hypothetical protein